MDTNEYELSKLATEYGIKYIYDTEDALLENPEIDAVYIASPVSFHKDQAIKTLKAGKHLLLEKPLGLDVAESEEIRAYVNKTELKAGAAMVMRHHDGHRKIKDLIQSGKLGNIVSSRAQLTCWFPDLPGNWRQIKSQSGGGSLMDMGIHCIDLLQFLLNDSVESVCGYISTKEFSYEVEDSASILFKMKKGTVCYVDSYFNIPDAAAKCLLEIYGTKGSIIAGGTIGQDGGGEIKLTISDQSGGYESMQQRNEEILNTKLEYDKKNIYAKQIESFSDCILCDLQPDTTIEEAHEEMLIIEAMYKAASQGITVRCD